MLSVTLADAPLRAGRLGHNVCLLWPAPSVAAAITAAGAQMVVEQQLAREGTSRQEVGREAFTERVWAWRRQCACSRCASSCHVMHAPQSQQAYSWHTGACMPAAEHTLIHHACRGAW